MMSCQKCVKTDGFELKYLFPAQPSPFTRHNGKCNILHIKQRNQIIWRLIFVISSHLVQNRKDQKSEAFYGKNERLVKNVGQNVGTNGTIGSPNGVNSDIMINPSNIFFIFFIFYVYISIFLLFAHIVLLKTVLIC